MSEKVRTKFDVWFFRVIWIGLLVILATLAVWIAIDAVNIAMAGGEGAGWKAGVLLAIQAVVMATLARAVMRTPKQWRAFTDRSAAGALVSTSHDGIKPRIANWLKRTWQETDPAKDVVPSSAEMPSCWLLAGGLNDATIKRLKANPRAFPNTLRRFGFSFGGVRGAGCAARSVGAIHYLWSRLA